MKKATLQCIVKVEFLVQQVYLRRALDIQTCNVDGGGGGGGGIIGIN